MGDVFPANRCLCTMYLSYLFHLQQFSIEIIVGC